MSGMGIGNIINNAVDSAAVRGALKNVRRTGMHAGVKATTTDLKEAARLAYGHEGTQGLNNLISGKRSSSIHMIDAKSGYDEVDYPNGAAKLPKGTIKTNLARKIAAKRRGRS